MGPVREIVLNPMFLFSTVAIVVALGGAILFTRPRRDRQHEAVPAVAGPVTRRKDSTPAPSAVPETRFSDVAGIPEAVTEVRELCEYLADPERFRALGGAMPKGVLLVGPPGTGKTLLTRALAGEAGVPLFAASASSFVEVYVGVGASRIRDLFAQARKNAPAIVFLDELDAVGRARVTSASGGQEERESTLNQLLVEMDGFDPHEGVIVVAATNRGDLLDPALVRPGRFDRQIVVDAPDLAGRRAILALHARNKPLADPTDLEVMARRTSGFTGADLANLLNEAALLAARSHKRSITMIELDEAVDRVMAGPARRSRVISEREKQIIAYHEGGHALVASVLAHADDVEKVSIVSRGRSHGFTMTFSPEDRTLVSRNQLRHQLAVLLGGRVAEELVFADPTTGAQDDLERATAIAHQMVSSFGMSDRVGPVSLLRSSDGAYSLRGDAIVGEADAEVRRLLDEARALAVTVVQDHRGELDALVRVLIERETLERTEIERLLGHLPPRFDVDRSPGTARRRNRPVDTRMPAAS